MNNLENFPFFFNMTFSERLWLDQRCYPGSVGQVRLQNLRVPGLSTVSGAHLHPGPRLHSRIARARHLPGLCPRVYDPIPAGLIHQ